MRQLDQLLEQSILRIALRLSTVEEEFYKIAGERLAKIHGLTNEQVKEYLYSGEYLDGANADLRKIRRALQKAHKSNLKDMNGLFGSVVDTIYEEGSTVATIKGQALLPLAVFKQSFNPMLKKIRRQYEIMAASSVSKDSVAGRAYRQTISRYINKIAYDPEKINAPQAIRSAIKELTQGGITTVQYASGRQVRMDTNVRQHILSEFTNIVQSVEQKLADELQADGVEISAHIAPAIDHESINGIVLERAEFEKLQNHELATDIDGNTHLLEHRAVGEHNCKHIWFPFFLGISERAYSPERLEQIERENEKGITFRGEHYTLYQSSQLQRQLEASIRAERERNNALKAVRDIPEMQSDYSRSKARLAGLQSTYRELGSALAPKSMRMKPERMSVPRGSTGNVRL